MAWSTVHFRIFQLQGWLGLLHHWLRQGHRTVAGTLGGKLGGPKAGLEGRRRWRLERRRGKVGFQLQVGESA